MWMRAAKCPKSAAANPVEYTEFFEPFAKEYDAVIHISVSSKLSSCYQNACLAAQEYDNVSVIDSENICTGQGYLVLRAAKWAADGLTARNISMRLQSLANRVELSFVLNQLNYMAKSGRCSGVLAFGANLLGIKPSLAIIDGELKVVRKYRGSLPICVGKYITDLLDGTRRHRGQPCVHLVLPAEARLHGRSEGGSEKYGSFKEYHETDIGTTIGGYSGPGTIGIVFAGKIKKWLLHMRQPLFLTGSGVLKFHPEWHRPHRPCSSAAAPQVVGNHHVQILFGQLCRGVFHKIAGLHGKTAQERWVFLGPMVPRISGVRSRGMDMSPSFFILSFATAAGR